MRALVAVCLLFVFGQLCAAEIFKLYLKSGDFQLVREYQRQGERIRYLSSERGEWEELPASLVDFAKTERERKQTSDARSVEDKAQEEEEQAVRTRQREIASVPMEAGAYLQSEKGADGIYKSVPSASFEVITDKKRRAMQMISPVPLLPGRASVVIKGDHATTITNESRPYFFLRLAKQDRFGILQLTPKKGQRIVENISVQPVSKQAFEDRKQMAAFDEQLSWNLYRVWPEKPLSPGEYALVEFSNAETSDDLQLLIWDFSVRP